LFLFFLKYGFYVLLVLESSISFDLFNIQVARQDGVVYRSLLPKVVFEGGEVFRHRKKNRKKKVARQRGANLASEI
jgi:hypothetical protein